MGLLDISLKSHIVFFASIRRNRPCEKKYKFLVLPRVVLLEHKYPPLFWILRFFLLILAPVGGGGL